MKNKRDVSGKKISVDSEKKYQGIVLESYKNSLVEVDKMHMKVVIELKGILNKNEKLEKFLNWSSWLIDFKEDLLSQNNKNWPKSDFLY